MDFTDCSSSAEERRRAGRRPCCRQARQQHGSSCFVPAAESASGPQDTSRGAVLRSRWGHTLWSCSPSGLCPSRRWSLWLRRSHTGLGARFLSHSARAPASPCVTDGMFTKRSFVCVKSYFPVELSSKIRAVLRRQSCRQCYGGQRKAASWPHWYLLDFVGLECLVDAHMCTSKPHGWTDRPLVHQTYGCSVSTCRL